jgi:membrane fusion protein (multidrug efflux system)
MSTPFSHTLRALKSDHFHGVALGLFSTALLIGAWVLWLLKGRVTLYELSREARLEVREQVHPLSAPLAGLLVSTRLTMGLSVQAGEVLAELDSQPQKLALAEGRARLLALHPQRAALQQVIAAEELALKYALGEASAAVSEASFRRGEEELALRHARREAERMEGLFRGGALRELDLTLAHDETDNHEARAATLLRQKLRLSQNIRTQSGAARVRIATRRLEAAELDGRIRAEEAALERLELEIERRRLRAPISGTVGEVAELRVGSVVREGEQLALLLPAGRLRVIADFPAATALGKLKAGQPARLRLAGFPWVQYGAVNATVSRVAAEVRGAEVHAELELATVPGTLAPLQHGLPGTVEVAVERVSPLTLLLRAVGTTL